MRSAPERVRTRTGSRLTSPSRPATAFATRWKWMCTFRRNPKRCIGPWRRLCSARGPDSTAASARHRRHHERVSNSLGGDLERSRGRGAVGSRFRVGERRAAPARTRSDAGADIRAVYPVERGAQDCLQPRLRRHARCPLGPGERDRKAHRDSAAGARTRAMHEVDGRAWPSDAGRGREFGLGSVPRSRSRSRRCRDDIRSS